MGNQPINRMLKLKSRPEGEVTSENFELIEEEVRDLADGEILIKVLYLSFDPTQRGWLNDVPSYIPPVQIGEVMRAASVGQVVESRNDQFNVGDVVQGSFGWQEYSITTGTDGFMSVQKIPEGIPPTSPLSIYGITGLTAYFGMLDIGKPQDNDTVLVSGAAGATGSVAGQIARINGATNIIGIAGGPEKCKWVVEEAGFDSCIDYKNENVAERIPELAPKGLNIYFDNVGGSILEHSLANIALNARVVMCGGISSGYTMERLQAGPSTIFNLIIQRARMEGFIVLDYADRFLDAIAELAGWVGEGKIKYQEDIAEGLENCPETLAKLFKGKNFGKQLLKLSDPT
ncbi:MAG: NADP-dependent oxidoreductase [Pseudomonadota bacterium]|nr:NADP-dependent oxidoreductase [Pseudomonadota bacterium]MEC9458919.1 NADP-dependent oxidoreductase [Pseudomonadota bacterium]